MRIARPSPQVGIAFDEKVAHPALSDEQPPRVGTSLLVRQPVDGVVGDHDAEKTGLTLAAMADASKSDWQTAIGPASESVLGMIRVAFYAHQVSEAVDMITHASEQGYETMANLMAVSNITDEEIDLFCPLIFVSFNSPPQPILVISFLVTLKQRLCSDDA